MLGGAGAAVAFLMLCRHGAIEASFAEQVVGCGACIAGSLLPDVDTPSSKVGRAAKPLSILLNKVAGHRTLTHSLFVPMILFYLAILVMPTLAWLLLPLGFGILSHIVFDVFTKGGVSILWPLPLVVSMPIVYTRSAGEKLFAGAVLAIDAALVVTYMI